DGLADLQNFLYNTTLGSEKRLNKLMHSASKGKKAGKLAVEPGVRLYKKIGLDLAAITLAILPYKYLKNGFISEFGHHFEYKKNPSDNMTILYYMGGSFKSFEDYEQFPLPDPDNVVRNNFFNAMVEIEQSYEGAICCAPGITGMMEMTWEGFGLENFSKLLANRKNAKKVFDDRGNFSVEMVKRLIEWDYTGPMLIFDDYGYKKGLFMSPKNYQIYVLPWLQKICETAHKGGIQVILHSCGDIYQIFEEIIKCGVDAIHPLEPTTSNPEYNIFNLNNKYGDKITFVGNISPQDLSDKDPKTILDYTVSLIRQIAPGGGFILSSGHSINPAVKLENFLAMRDALQKYGSYPIQL
ncbi:MAG: uroporphyrinogen decarboxylase family protein, partial [Candidatus Thorarchaeota archaeon]